MVFLLICVLLGNLPCVFIFYKVFNNLNATGLRFSDLFLEHVLNKDLMLSSFHSPETISFYVIS